jgi:hypothetical protein
VEFEKKPVIQLLSSYRRDANALRITENYFGLSTRLAFSDRDLLILLSCSLTSGLRCNSSLFRLNGISPLFFVCLKREFPKKSFIDILIWNHATSFILRGFSAGIPYSCLL